jgi:hypothetical protein
VPLGFALNKQFGVKKESIAPIIVYVLVTTVIFQAAYSAELTWQRFSLPLLFFGLICLTAGVSYLLFQWFYPANPPEKNLLVFSSTASNVGYFGLPLSLIILGESGALLVALSILGFSIFQNTLGFYIISRGQYSAKESLLKIAKLPPIYGFLAGLLCNLINLPLSPEILSLLQNFRGAYSVLGMMIIGIAFADIPKVSFHGQLFGLSLLSKFLVWPLLSALFIWLDLAWLHWYDSLTHQVILLLSAVPVGANVVAYATLLKVEAEKASFLVISSTLVALLFLPLFIWLFIQ